MNSHGPLNSSPIVTVFGGSGFLGRFVVAALAERGYRVRVAVRRPDLAWFLKPLGDVGQIQPIQANLRNQSSIEHAVKGAVAVVNLTGILQESGKQKFEAIHVDGPKMIAQSLAPQTRMIHVSALGADVNSPSAYARSKAQGESKILEICPQAVIFRPSVLFGEGDKFFNRLAWICRLSPVLPLPGLKTLMQPVYAKDVAEAIARAVDGNAQAGTIYELGGPLIQDMGDIMNYVSKVTYRKRKFFNMPKGIAKFHAFMMELTYKLSLGLLPEELLITRDQLHLMEGHTIVSHEAIKEKRTFEGLSILPQSYEAIVPEYLTRFRPKGQFETMRKRDLFEAETTSVNN